MTVHKFRNSIIFRIFKTSLAITPPSNRKPPPSLVPSPTRKPHCDALRTKIHMWLTPNLILFDGDNSGYWLPSQHSYRSIFLIVEKSRYNQNSFWRTVRVCYLNKCLVPMLFWDLHYRKWLNLPICCFP